MRYLQAPGRNATGGSFKMGAVLDVFRDAAQKLRLATSMARAQEVTGLYFTPCIDSFGGCCSFFEALF